MINLKPWQHFLSVAAYGSLTRASLQLDIAQPALSREMMDLERQLGVKLFTRHARGLQLTPAGETFKKRAAAVLEDVRAITEGLALDNNIPSGRLSIGMPPAMNATLTSKVLERFCAKYPQVSIYVVENTTNELRKNLIDRQVDIAILAKMDPVEGLDITPLLSEALFLVGKRNSIPKQKETSIRAMLELPLILAPLPNAIHRIVRDAYLNYKAVPHVIMEANSWSLGRMIELGLGYAIMPECALLALPADMFSSARVKGLRVEWFIATLSHRAPSVAAFAFSAMLQDFSRSAIAEGTWKSARPWHLQRPKV